MDRAHGSLTKAFCVANPRSQPLLQNSPPSNVREFRLEPAYLRYNEAEHLAYAQVILTRSISASDQAMAAQPIDPSDQTLFQALSISLGARSRYGNVVGQWKRCTHCNSLSIDFVESPWSSLYAVVELPRVDDVPYASAFFGHRRRSTGAEGQRENPNP